MRFIVDAQLPLALCRWLQAGGHEAEHVFELDLIDATDAVIAARAVETGATLISKDEDFLLLRQPDRFVFVWLRVGNATNPALEAWLTARWPVVEAMLAAGERLIEVR
jgi:predicted nuclease of predicted toxin-antitoxin system